MLREETQESCNYMWCKSDPPPPKKKCLCFLKITFHYMYNDVKLVTRLIVHHLLFCYVVILMVKGVK